MRYTVRYAGGGPLDGKIMDFEQKPRSVVSNAPFSSCAYFHEPDDDWVPVGQFIYVWAKMIDGVDIFVPRQLLRYYS